MTPVLQVVHRVITRHLLGQAGLKPDEADSGAVTLIQRFVEARLVGLDKVVVKEHASTAHQAIDGALRKLKRAVASEIDKHDGQAHRGQPDTFAARGKPD